MTDILVIGSLNADLVVRVPRFPAPGETISGSDLATLPGGKGANQAVAAAKLGTSVAMLGRVGRDQLGQMLLDNLRRQQVDVSAVRESDSATGTAVILVNEQGQNCIVISPGANGQVIPSDVQAAPQAKIMLLQLEIPLETVLYAAKWGKERGMTVILNPAPARELPDEIFENVDIVVPNESELSLLTGKPVTDYAQANAAIAALMERGAKQVILTMGERGAIAQVDFDSGYFLPAFEVNAVDTTAAGDAFIGGLAASFARGIVLPEALHYASACGALAVTKFGAQPSLPGAEEVQAFLSSNIE